MAWNFCKGKNISDQIADKVAIDILTGAVLPAQRLPSIEDMSKITGASARVVAEAYDELIREGIVVKESVFIISDDITAAQKRRDKLAQEVALRFYDDLSELGLSKPEQLRLFGNIILGKTRK